MSKRFLIISILLSVCLFIYVFYRTEYTVINEIVQFIFSKKRYLLWKQSVSKNVKIPQLLIGSLAEGLWVLVITLLSKDFYLNIFKVKFKLVYLPILLAIVVELFQLFHFSKGVFDLMDVVFSFTFWLIGFFFTDRSSVLKNILSPFKPINLACLLAYIIVFLAHVNSP